MILDLFMQPGNHFKLPGVSLWMSLAELWHCCRAAWQSLGGQQLWGIFSICFSTANVYSINLWSKNSLSVQQYIVHHWASHATSSLWRKMPAQGSGGGASFSVCLCCNSDSTQPSWAATTSPSPAREAVRCVSFNNHCVADAASAVPQLSCSEAELIFPGRFTEQGLEHQSTIKISATLTYVGGLAQRLRTEKVWKQRLKSNFQRNYEYEGLIA